MDAREAAPGTAASGPRSEDGPRGGGGLGASGRALPERGERPAADRSWPRLRCAVPAASSLRGADLCAGSAGNGRRTGGVLRVNEAPSAGHGVCNALSLEIKASPKVRAFIGEQVLLKCSFKSSSPITESLTVDWTYRPLTGGQMESIFHYQSVPYPTTVGKFKDRISWVGNVAKGDASIAIQSPVMSDNGTFICSVKNPPDVYHNIPQTMLIVTERGLSFQLTSAVLLSILVFLPSVIVVVLLLVRMGRKFGVLKEKKKSGCKKSSIEVSDEPEHTETDNCLGKLRNWCLNCVDTDEEDPY